MRWKEYHRSNAISCLPDPVPITLCHTVGGRSVGNAAVISSEGGQVKIKTGFEVLALFSYHSSSILSGSKLNCSPQVILFARDDNW